MEVGIQTLVKSRIGLKGRGNLLDGRVLEKANLTTIDLEKFSLDSNFGIIQLILTI